MIKFLFKGIIRDRSRSLLPVIVVALGVFLTVFLSGYMRGVFTDITDLNAKFSTGHVKILTHAYAENADQVPNDLALIDVKNLINQGPGSGCRHCNKFSHRRDPGSRSDEYKEISR
jgi:putative ABC transport system permease protein